MCLYSKCVHKLGGRRGPGSGVGRPVNTARSRATSVQKPLLTWLTIPGYSANLNDINLVLDQIFTKLPSLRLKGIHKYLGSGCLFFAAGVTSDSL